MSKEMQLFHGSASIIEHPKVIISGFYKDFGDGFYCANIEKQAKRWALTRKSNHVVNIYKYKANEQVKILQYNEMTDEWLDFVVACRGALLMNMTS